MTKILKTIACIALLPFCVVGGLLIGLIVAIAYTINMTGQLWGFIRG